MSLTLGLSLTAFRPALGTAAPDPGGPGLLATVADFSRDRTLFDSGAAMGLNAAAVPRSGTTDAPDGTAIEMRIVRADTGQQVAPWAAVATASAGGWSGAYPGVPRAPHWLRPEVRVAGSAATATTANRFGVGHVWAIWQQSEHHRMLSNSFSRTAIETPLAEEAVQFVTHGRVSDGSTSGVDTITRAPAVVTYGAAAVAAGDITASLAAMANVLIAERPGEKFCIVFQTLSGTSWLNAASDGIAERIFANDRLIHALATSDGQKVGLCLSSWFARPRSLRAQWGAGKLAFTHGKTYDGADFVDAGGLVNGGAGDHALTLAGATYDIDHTARELYGTTPPWVISGPHRFEPDGDQRNSLTDGGGGTLTELVNIDLARASARKLVADHPGLFRKGLEMLSYINGYDMLAAGEQAFPDWGDLSHPNANDDDGLPRFARLTAQALLHGAGLTGFEEPVFNRAHWDPAGAHAEFWFEDSAGNRPDMTTTRIARGEALQTRNDLDGVPMPHVTEVFGWEINRRPAERAEIATGTVVASKVVRVYPQAGSGSFVGTDLIEFGRGGSGGKVRDPEDFYGEYWKNMPLAALPVAGVEGIPVSAQPVLANPLPAPVSLLPFERTPLQKTPNNAYVAWQDANGATLGTSPNPSAAQIYLSRNDNLNATIAWDISALLASGDFGTFLVEIEIIRPGGSQIARPFEIVTKVATNSGLTAGVNDSETLLVPAVGLYQMRLDFLTGTTPWVGFTVPAAPGGNGATRGMRFRRMTLRKG